MSDGEGALETGDLGESDFHRWCVRNRLTSNKSNPDRMGWDYFIEFPQSAKANLALDQQNDLKKAVVQVKATRKSIKSVRGKLSAFKCLVDADIPAFIACLRFDSNDRVIDARLLHVAGPIIEFILARVRQSEADGATALNKVIISLPLDSAERIQRDGSNLRSLLEASIGASNSEYLIQKIETRASCGYDENSVHARFSLAESEDKLADFLIGKLPELSVRDCIIERRRFGIALPVDIDRFGSGTLSFQPMRQGVATITLSNKSLHRSVTIEADVLSSAAVGLPAHLQRGRIYNDCLDVVFNPAERSLIISFNVDAETEYALADLSKRLQIGYLLSEYGTELQFGFGNQHGRGLEIPHPLEGLSQIHQQVLCDFVETICSALLKYRPGTQLSVTMSELSASLRANNSMFAALKNPGFTAAISADVARQIDAIWRVVFVAPIVLSLKSIAYLAVAVAECTWEFLPDGSIAVVGGKPNVVWDALEDDNYNCISKVMDRAKAAKEAQTGGNVLVIVGSLEKREDAPTLSKEGG